MYEFRDEATRALTPKSARPFTEATAPESWTFQHLAVSHSASLTHVQFKSVHAFGEETANDLRVDFSQLADKLVRDSKVLLDFVGVKSFCAAAIDELILFNQKLRTKGSRIALCGLDSSVHQSFFTRNNGNEKAT
jgi:anti-anti-sigma regulatory factor